MISAKFLWGNVLLGGKLQIGAKNSNFEIFESALYMKSVSMPLTYYRNAKKKKKKKKGKKEKKGKKQKETHKNQNHWLHNLFF